MSDDLSAYERDWVIEHFERRIIGVQVLTSRVNECGRWVPTGIGQQELSMSYRAVEEGKMSGPIPRFRQGQRFTLDSAMTKMTRCQIIMPEFEWRIRNVETGDFIMGAVVCD